jgi:hypothetical protein
LLIIVVVFIGLQSLSNRTDVVVAEETHDEESPEELVEDLNSEEETNMVEEVANQPEEQDDEVVNSEEVTYQNTDQGISGWSGTDYSSF